MTNITTALEAILPPKNIAFLRATGEIAAREGLPLFLVGGSVRDILLAKPVMDLDLVAQGDALLLASIIAKELGGEVTARSQFGTAKITTLDTTVDIATARRESYASPGALPTVWPGNIEDDLLRRDFSINALAMDLSPKSFGYLLDPYGGEGDLYKRLIRVLHKQSFMDDATRILRALRYEQRLGFEIEQGTLDLIKRDKSYLDTISGDRIRHELERIFQEPQPEKVLARAGALGVLEAISRPLKWPEELNIKISQERQQGRQWAPLVYLAFLASELSPSHGKELADRLKLPNRSSRVVADTIDFRRIMPGLDQEGVAPSHIYSVCKEISPETLEAWAVLAPQQRVRHSLALFLKELRFIKPKLAGHQLLAIGVPKGPLVGQLLEELRQARIDGQIATEKDEEALLRRRLRELEGS